MSSTHFQLEDRRDPVAVIAGALVVLDGNDNLLDRADYVYRCLLREHVITTCVTYWLRGESDRHADGSAHKCGNPVGHPGRHTCEQWHCRSWRGGA